jgi:FkbM family methyltransferase
MANLFKSSAINPIFRGIYKMFSALDRVFRGKMLGRIRVYGTVDLHFEGHSFKMFSAWDDHIVDMLYFSNRSYSEFTELSIFNALAKDSKVILDIGANTGLYSILSARANPKAQIIGFEPYPVNFARLHKNMGVNGIQSQVELVNLALGDSNSKIQFAVPAGGQICDVSSADVDFTKSHYQKWLSYKEIEVEQTTLDHFCTERNFESVDLIKIDVEYYELSVLKGAVESLAKYSPVILIEIFVDEERCKFFEEVLKPMGYHAYLIMMDGLIRTEGLIENPDCGNIVLSKQKSSSEYLSFSDMSLLIGELR